MFRNPTPGIESSHRNISLIPETDFNVVPDNTFIWEGVLPFKQGDDFPTAFIKERASIFKTNDALYENKAYDEIFSTIVNFNDYMRDAITNFQVLKVIPNIPDWKMILDMWVDLMFAKEPKIDSKDSETISSISTILSNSNFAVACQKACGGALFKYGNAVYRVDKQRGGNPKVVEMPIKSWIPFVNENDISTIDVNCFFNIFKRGSSWFCEFILYHEDGKIEKYTFEYNKQGSKLGQLISTEESEAYDGAGVSPIVVFTGQTTGNSVYGNEQFSKWETSIISSMKSYETVLILLERLKEIYRVIPEGATQRDENTGITYQRQTGSIAYKVSENSNANTVVDIVVPQVLLTDAINAYKETVLRVSRDTDIVYTILDTKELGTNISGKALKTAMYRTELKAKSYLTLLTNSLKQLVVKIALARGIEIDPSDFTISAESGFVSDIETLTDIIQKRVGNIPTISLENAISILDDVSIAEAEERANYLLGKPIQDKIDVSNTDSGDGSEISPLGLSHVANEDKNTNKEPGKPLSAYPLGGPDINVQRKIST